MKIDKNIFKVEFTKGTGAGGQHRNKVETCAVVTHIPSGQKEKSEDTRFKNRNLQLAYDRLVKRLKQQILDKQHEELNEMKNRILEERGTIRTYNYQRNEVKDHETGNVFNLKNVLDGDLEPIMKQSKHEK